MVAKNEVTGDALRSKGPSKKYDEGWDRIFGKKNKDKYTNNENQAQGNKDGQDTTN